MTKLPRHPAIPCRPLPSRMAPSTAILPSHPLQGGWLVDESTGRLGISSDPGDGHRVIGTPEGQS